MNASEPPAQNKQKDISTTRVQKIHAELLRAKSRQRKRYVIVTFILLAGAVFTLGVIGFSNGTVIEVEPQDAQATAVVNMVDGFGKALGNTVYSLSKNPTIEISASGFRPLKRTLRASETGGRITVTLAELPGQLHITTRPDSDKTRWSIDGNMVGVSKTLKHELFAGKHTVDIDSLYFQKKSIPVRIERAKKMQLTVNLEPVSGQLNIKTVPAGASIHINGELAGISPLSITKSGGAYRIEITFGDYQNIIENVEITNTDNTIERDYRLALKDAYLNVSVSPAGGKLLLNGKVVNPSDTLTVKAHTENVLIYTKNGYFSQNKTFSTAPGEKKQISFQLKAEMGRISFISMPNATIRVDGNDVGRTPLVLTLSAVPHRVEFHKQGYRTYRKTVIPSSKSTQKIRAALRTELGARLAEMPRRFNNSIGIELKQFRPDSTFVMGAPRYEKGQRANEFLHTVRLDTPFYISTHEVTRAQFSRFASGHGSGNEPVSAITWLQAAQFCNWLSQREKLTPFYRISGKRLLGSNAGADGYRLPSEAEWEWLARKAGKAAQTRFTWGDETIIPEKAGNIADESAKGKTARYVPNYSDGYAGVAPVGSFPPEKSGLYDMTGNVSEWVHDVYSLTPPDPQQVQTDPLGENRGDTHTVKGSNWRSGTITELRAAYREGEKAARDDIGFRIARYVYGGSHGQK